MVLDFGGVAQESELVGGMCSGLLDHEFVDVLVYTNDTVAVDCCKDVTYLQKMLIVVLNACY